MLTGEKKIAEFYLGKFTWGHSFLTLNEELLTAYAECKDGAEIIQAQEKHLEAAQLERQHRRGNE
jgi:pre-rRNA-processing protein TSR3